MGAAPVILMEGVSKDFSTGWPWKKVRALVGVDLEVRPGEIIGYLGPNGAGKTTTLKLLTGLLSPTAGRVLLNGRDPRDPAARSSLGFLPENPWFYEYLTGREFLALSARLAGGRAAAHVGPLLERVGLGGPAADRPLRKYSKGMLQRVGLAQALVGDPSVLVLDEPMSGLDPLGRREVRDLVLALKAEGKTILFSSHILPDVELVCDRVAFVHLGRLLEVRDLKDLPWRHGGGVEVEAAGLGGEALERLAPLAREVIRGREGAAFLLDSDERLPGFLEALGREGGALVSVTPRRESLEELFLRLVGEGPR